MIVIDASALAAFLLKEPIWKELAEYLKYAVSIDHIVKEVANTIWKAHMLRRIIDANNAIRLYRILLSMMDVNILIEAENKYMDEAFKIALKHNITVYDALYIALAKRKNLPLLTLDKKQARIAKKLGIHVVSLET